MRTKLLVVVTSILVFAQISGCGLLKEDRFAIILADTGEILLTESDIEAYHSDGTLDLNENGMKKWNSHLTYPGIPKLKETLYQREFIIRIDEKEICRGKFWSMVSSASINDIVILDSLMKMDDDYHSIWIRSTYPSGKPLADSISSELDRFFGEVKN